VYQRIIFENFLSLAWKPKGGPKENFSISSFDLIWRLEIWSQSWRLGIPSLYSSINYIWILIYCVIFVDVIIAALFWRDTNLEIPWYKYISLISEFSLLNFTKISRHQSYTLIIRHFNFLPINVSNLMKCLVFSND